MNMLCRTNGMSRGAVAAAIMALGWGLSASPVVRGELTVVENADGKTGLSVFKMTVTPAAAPTPAFKYRLLPSEADLLPGNAALYYSRAFAEGGVSSVWKSIEKDFGYDEVHGGDKSEGWYTATRPLADLPLDKVRQAAARFDVYMQQCVERGTMRQDCDWGRNLEEISGIDVIAVLLPEIQESRSLARLMVMRTRVAIADRDYERAINHLRMIYRLGQNVGRETILISGLVGIAECGMANHELIELIAAKDAPNLYWALAAMPRPLVDIRPAVRYELGWGMQIFPVIGKAETAEHSPEEWARLLSEGLVGVQAALGGSRPFPPELSRLAVTGLAIVGYPDAKRRLIAGGMPPDAAEKMPVGQVIAIDGAREYRRIGDEIEKWWYLPFPAARKAGDPTDKAIGPALEGGYGRLLASFLMPALSAVRNAEVRVDWQLNALQVIEAIRLHASESGKLPASLKEITSVPVPENPATGAPFDYRLDGDTAVLELPFSDGFIGAAWRFEIQLAKQN